VADPGWHSTLAWALGRPSRSDRIDRFDVRPVR
jgi:hypothetical protein